MTRPPPFLFRSAYRSLLTFRGVVELAALDDEVLFVVLAVAVDIDFDDELAALAVAALAGVVAEAVLVAHERVDGAERGGQLALEGDGDVRAARLFGEGAERVLRLEDGHAAGAGRAVEPVERAHAV